MSIVDERIDVMDEMPDKSSFHDDPTNGHKAELEELLEALISLRKGEFTVRLPQNWVGLRGKVADTFNDVMDQLEGMTNEVDRISRVVGKEGKIKQRASAGHLRGSWAGTIDSVNQLISDLAHPTSEMARVVGAIAKGDLSQSMALDINARPLEGEFLRTARTVNRMVEQLGSRPR
jgi:methyl-accepting chemotaxis protein